MISDKGKQEITEALYKYCRRFKDENNPRSTGAGKAAIALKISKGTMSAILSGKWDQISETMWKNIRMQISDSTTNGEWEIVETPTFKDVSFTLKKAQKDKEMTWLIAKAGSGKTMAAEYYRATNKDVVYVLCDEDMRKSSFAIEMARAAGYRINTQKLAREKMIDVIDFISEMDNPLIIFDEADKLNDTLLYYFISIYNRLKKKAGIVLLSTNYMQRRLENGLNRGWKGYDEISSRIGRKFYEAEEPTANDVYAICRANGISDEKFLSDIVKDASGCNFDLRRVERKVLAVRRKQQIMVEQ